MVSKNKIVFSECRIVLQRINLGNIGASKEYRLLNVNNLKLTAEDRKLKLGKNRFRQLHLPKDAPQLQQRKLRMMLSRLEEVKTKKCQREHAKCLRHSSVTPIWTSRCWILKAVNECLLTRNWNYLTFILLELIHSSSILYKPLIRHVYTIMDKLHPVLYENDMQGEFKKIKKIRQDLGDDSTVV